jgi:hypothetical protein
MKRTWTTVGAVVLLVALAVIPAAASGPPNPGTGSSDFYVMNVDGANSAMVNVNYYGQDGVSDTTDSVSLNAYGSRAFESGTLPVGDGWVGSVVLSSDRQVAAVSNIVWTGGQYGDGMSAGAYAGADAPGMSLYLPYVSRVIDVRFSTMTIQNAGTGTATVTMNYFNSDGTSVGAPIVDTIGEGRSKTYDMSSPGGKTPSLPSPFNGAVVATANKPIAGTVTTHWKYYASAYDGFAAGSTSGYLPSVYRKNRADVGLGWIRHSNILVQNLSGSTADVDIDFYPTGSTSSALHLDDSIPGNSAHEYNTRFGTPGLFEASVFEALGGDFDGSVVVQSSQNVVAVDHTFWTNLNEASTYKGMPSGATQVFMAWQPRVKVGGWLTWSKLVIQNLSASTANISLTYYDANGTVKATFGDNIPGYSADGYNTRYGSDGGGISAAQFSVLGDSFTGSVRVQSNVPVAPVMNVIEQTNWASTYNGFVP